MQYVVKRLMLFHVAIQFCITCQTLITQATHEDLSLSGQHIRGTHDQGFAHFIPLLIMTHVQNTKSCTLVGEHLFDTL